MKPVAFPELRLTRTLAGVALLAVVGAAPVVAEARRPAPKHAGWTPLAAPVWIAPREVTDAAAGVGVCGTSAVTPAEAEGVGLALRRWRDDHVTPAPGGIIRVAVHVITARGEGDVADARLGELIAALDRGFAATGYRFELALVDRTEEPAWFRMTPGSSRERKAKQALAVDPTHHLNIYTCAPGENLAGWASLPWSASEGSEIHGVVLDHASLPGGEGQAVTAIAIHQVGHYLGLLHDEESGKGHVERIRTIVPVYRPSLFNSPTAPPARPEIAPEAGAEPEDGRVLAYRGAFPNPFRAETALRFTIPTSQPVSLRIYSVTGQLVRTLVDAPLPPGDHSAMFRADGLPSGAYFAVLRVGRVQMSRTLMLVR